MKRYKLFILFFVLMILTIHPTQAQNKKYTGQWLINASGKFMKQGYGFSLGGEKYLHDSYSSIRGEFIFLQNRNNFKIKDIKCHVNSFTLHLTYLYSLETLNIKPLFVSIGGGIFIGLEKINGNFAYGIVKQKDNHFLFGFHFSPQIETQLYQNFSAYLEPLIGIRTNTFQDRFMYSISLGIKYYLPFK